MKNEKLPMVVFNDLPRNYPFNDNPSERISYIKEMNCNAVHISPVLKSVNGSNYAPDYSLHTIDYDPQCFECSLEKDAIENEEAERLLRKYIEECKKRDIRVFYDFVPGHAGVGARIVKEAPHFFSYDESGEIIHQSCPGQFYEDLVRFNYEENPKGLYEFAYKLAEHFVNLGVDGFRCDMAVHLCPDMWKYVIGKVKEKHPHIIFIGESFGTTPDKIIGLGDAGFDMYYNSSFWWNLGEDWLKEQTDRFADANLKSVGILANHDTDRWLPSCGSIEVAEMKMKLMIFLNSSISITAGDEIGVTKRYNVFEASPFDADVTPPHHDFRELFANTVATKLSRKALCAERFDVTNLPNQEIYVIRKEAEGDVCEILVNNCLEKRTVFYNNCYVTIAPFGVSIL